MLFNCCEQCLAFLIGYTGVCQGVIALNMEDGTLHRFRAVSTILATGVTPFFFVSIYGVCWNLFTTFHDHLLLVYTSFLCSYFRVTVGLTFLQPRHIHVQEMAMPWLPELAFLSRFFYLFFLFGSLNLFFGGCSYFLCLICWLVIPTQDLEFVQFHPTGIYGAGCLITEGLY